MQAHLSGSWWSSNPHPMRFRFFLRTKRCSQYLSSNDDDDDDDDGGGSAGLTFHFGTKYSSVRSVNGRMKRNLNSFSTAE